MLEITVINCDDKKIQYEWATKREFVDDIDSDNENIPMLDDVIIAVNTNDEEISIWWSDTHGMIVNDLYKACKRKLANKT